MSEPTSSLCSLLFFRVAQTWFAAVLEDVDSIRDPSKTKGSFIDLSMALCGVRLEVAQDTSLLVVALDSKTARYLAVDCVDEITRIPRGQVRPLPPFLACEPTTSLVSGVVTRGPGDVVFLVNLKHLAASLPPRRRLVHRAPRRDTQPALSPPTHSASPRRDNTGMISLSLRIRDDWHEMLGVSEMRTRRRRRQRHEGWCLPCLPQRRARLLVHRWHFLWWRNARNLR